MLRIAGNEYSLMARGGFRIPEHLDPVVDPLFEDINIFKTIDVHRAEKMSDSFADTVRRCFLKECKRWNKRPPVRAAQHGRKDVDHRRQTVALVRAHRTG